MDIETTNKYLINSFELADDFALLYYEYLRKDHLYEKDHILTMLEMHTLAFIIKNPGILVTDIAKKWDRTLGAASKLVNKLEKKGYIIKKHSSDNKKNLHLYPTESGISLEKIHAEYDYSERKKTLQELLLLHTPEELETFFNVLESFIKVW